MVLCKYDVDGILNDAVGDDGNDHNNEEEDAKLGVGLPNTNQFSSPLHCVKFSEISQQMGGEISAGTRPIPAATAWRARGRHLILSTDNCRAKLY